MRLKFNYDVPDKYTREVYKKGKTYDFAEERANEILKVVNKNTGKPYAEVAKEKPKKKEEVVEEQPTELVIEESAE